MGTARAALRHRDFRVFWSGVFASNIGTWMQNIIVAAYVQTLTHDARWVGVVSFAPKLTSTTDEAEFLPKHYESIQAASVQEKEFPTQSQPGAILVFSRQAYRATTSSSGASAKPAFPARTFATT